MSQANSHITVSIAGRAFRMACGPGEEAHLEQLAMAVDARIATLRESFGEIGDARLTVMAAITFADELSEARRIIAQKEAEVAGVRAQGVADQVAREAREASLLQALDQAATRIAKAAHELDAGLTR